MKQSSGSDSYEFINSSSGAGAATGQDTRRLIRRQAMSRVAAARRQKGFWGQHNRRQYPASRPGLKVRAEAENEAAASGPVGVHSDAQQRGLMPVMSTRMAVPASVPCSGYEAMRMDYGFDLLDLSALTTFHTGRITAQLLSREPFRLAHVLRCRQWSYFSFLPSRYGHSACLDDAAHCVAARVRQWMSSPSDPPDDGVLLLYSKSLNSLQSALNDPVLCLQPETLCATAILAIHELLHSAGHEAWVRHVLGASALMKLRGPQRYQTDFERALFLAQAGPIYTEAILNDDRCFLEHDVWQNVFRSVVSETDALSDSSGVVVSLWTTICPIPSLFKDIQDTVCNFTDTDTRTIGSLFARAREIRTLLLQWRRQFEELPSSLRLPEVSGGGKQYETLGIYLTNLVIINRLSVALNTHAGLDLEGETQDLASQIIKLERRASATNPRASLFMAFKTIVAQATLDTKHEWQQAINPSIGNHARASSFINSQVFEHWVRLKGRKITSLRDATI